MQPRFRTHPDDTKAMQELYRVLKPGGMAILQIQDLSRAVTFADDTITDQKNALKSLVNTTMYAFMDEIILINYEQVYRSRRRLYQ
jgi:ubiquinone/menaquinone biosynthesis C-methylase UbiE